MITVNTRRGWMALARNDRRVVIRSDPAAEDADGRVLRPVNGDVVEITDAHIVIEADLQPVQRMLPSPFKFIVLRVLSLTLFRWLGLGNRVKRILANVLMSQSGRIAGRIRRTIELTSGDVQDEISRGDATVIDGNQRFSPKHMASQGYWQVQDDTPPET